MRPALIILLSLLAFATTGAATAHAQVVNAPPGLSGVDEYLETVPGATGAERPGGGSGGTLDDPEIRSQADAVLGDGTVRALEGAGADGDRAAALAAQGAPADARPAGSGAGRAVTPLAADESGTLPSRITEVVSGDAGAGVALPVGLAVVTVLFLLAALRRRRTATPA